MASLIYTDYTHSLFSCSVNSFVLCIVHDLSISAYVISNILFALLVPTPTHTHTHTGNCHSFVAALCGRGEGMGQSTRGVGQEGKLRRFLAHL